MDINRQQKDKEKIRKELGIHERDTNTNVHVPLKSQRKEIKNSNPYLYNIYMYIIHIKHEKPNLQEITFEFQNTALNAHDD